MLKINSKDKGAGGGGLHKLKEFINEWSGEVTIVSGHGFYKFRGNSFKECTAMDLVSNLPGTVITIKIPIRNIVGGSKPDYIKKYSIGDLLRMAN